VIGTVGYEIFQIAVMFSVLSDGSKPTHFGIPKMKILPGVMHCDQKISICFVKNLPISCLLQESLEACCL
jgi:hypothetical protein